MGNAIQSGRMFDFGCIRITPDAARTLHRMDVLEALTRHCEGDWGDVGEEDWAQNNYALDFGNRILSSYGDRKSNKFWIITEADRHATTILFPSEY